MDDNYWEPWNDDDQQRQQHQPPARLSHAWYLYYGYLYTTGMFSDAILRVRVTPWACTIITIPVHKWVLRYTSQYFDALFFGPAIVDPQRRDFPIVEYDVPLLRKFLELLYRNFVDIRSLVEAVKLYSFGDRYLSPSALAYCRRYITSKIDHANAFEVYAWARDNDEREIEAECRRVWQSYLVESFNNGTLGWVDLVSTIEVVLNIVSDV